MIFPIGDINRRSTFPFVNYFLILANIAAFGYMVLGPRGADAMVRDYALFPNHFRAYDLVTSMFLHADWLHLFGNMLFLWIVGDNVEDRYGHLIYLAFYLAAGIVAGIVHIITISAAEAAIPTVGASGAISGMMGAYCILFPRARILIFFFPVSLFVGLLRIWSFVAIGAWFALQLHTVFGSRAAGDPVAYWAHIGGFVFGAGVTLILRMGGVISPGNYLQQEASSS
jgi:membrane associated rhomboid family serine protease